MGIIEIKNLYKSFGATKVFSGLNLSIQKGEVVVIIGASGCGKSMLLRSIEMLEKPDAGQIFIDGQEITAEDADIGKIRRSMGMVFQDFGLFSNMSVIENLCIAPVKLLGMPKEEAEKKAMELLTSAGLATKANEPVRVLSGGQKQRIAICRCMMMDPPIILFDEPTSALDPLMVGKLLATLRLLARRGFTMVIVTHEMAFAKQIANRVVFLADGIVYEDGTPEEIFEHPKKEKTITFARKLRHLFCRVDNKKYDLAAIKNSITDFAAKYDVEEDKTNMLHFCAENITNVLLERLTTEKVEIGISISYSEIDHSCGITFNSMGDEFDFFNLIEKGKNGKYKDLAEKLSQVKEHSSSYWKGANVVKLKL
ncbi:MAG: amino acid ABC transporter ATP-binding protein [Phascolarctobacterium sp.]|nr:amino acid ABC transporter ATP-binding protein [Candidatus Phascolarctobacterium caballi]